MTSRLRHRATFYISDHVYYDNESAKIIIAVNGLIFLSQVPPFPTQRYW